MRCLLLLRQSLIPLAIALLPSFVAAEPALRGLPVDAAELRRVEEKVQATLPKAVAATVAVRLAAGGAGSGVIVSENGLVLTAGHVSGTPGQIAQIITSDGRTLRGKTLGRNGVEDYGMIQIEFTDVDTDRTLSVALMGKSSLVQPGDWVMALGHPGGYRKDRPPVLRLGRVAVQRIFIQTDAVLVGGDSGGPLFDLDGRVIGIHSRIGTNLNDNRHVPIDKFAVTWDRLVAGDDWNPAGDRVAWVRNVPWMGIDGEDDAAGYRVTMVDQSGPASKAGIVPGDVIIAFDGKEVGNERSLQDLVRARQVGDEVDVELLRESGDTLKLPVKLGRRPGGNG